MYELCDDKRRAFEHVFLSVTKRAGAASMAESMGSCRHKKGRGGLG